MRCEICFLIISLLLFPSFHLSVLVLTCRHCLASLCVSGSVLPQDYHLYNVIAFFQLSVPCTWMNIRRSSHALMNWQLYSLFKKVTPRTQKDNCVGDVLEHVTPNSVCRFEAYAHVNDSVLFFFLKWLPKEADSIKKACERHKIELRTSRHRSRADLPPSR